MRYDFDHQILSRNTFGLVEPSMMDDLPDGIDGKALVPKELEESAHLLPIQIELSKLSKQLQDALLECLFRSYVANEKPVVGLFINSDANAEEVTRHWNVMQVAAPHPARRYWLRLHDPRVLHQILRIATPAQRRKLFGPFKTLTYWVGGDWVTALAEGGNLEAAAEGSSIPYPGATRWDWPRVERIGMVNRALQGAGVRHAAALWHQGAVAERLFERAFRHHNLTRTEDMIEFATRGLTMRPGFDQDPDVAQAILPRAIPDDDCTLEDRFALIDEQIWSELRQPS